jgi:hypothetical protein
MSTTMTDRDAMRECGTEMRKYFYYASFGQFSLVNDRNGKNALALDAGYFDAARIPFSSVVAGVSIATISSVVLSAGVTGRCG